MKDAMGCKCAKTSSWIMRIVLAVIFLSASYGKIFVFGIPATAEMFQLPVFLMWIVALGELSAGLGVIVGQLIASQDAKGMLTRLSGGIIALVMLGAIFLVKWTGFEAGLLPGLQGIYADLAILALGLHFALLGNAGAECGMCEKK